MSLKMLKYASILKHFKIDEPHKRFLNIGLPVLTNYRNKNEEDIKLNNNYVGFLKNNEESEKSLAFDTCPDRFGTLSSDRLTRLAIEEGPKEEDDITEIEYIDGIKGKTRLKPINYAMMIKQFLKEKKLTDALSVLDHTMLEQHKAKPDLYIYNLLISGCGKYGYTKKAFQLFNQMKKRNIRPRLSTYTSLFNSCANGPWVKDALERAQHLREHMIEKGVEPNAMIYNSMIKAFGRHGDLETSFAIMDEMISKNIEIDSSTYNFLLQATASDKEAGFRHALLVWRKMLEKKILPTIHTFNLLLRCTRDCGAGDAQSVQELVELLSPFQQELIESKKEEAESKGLEVIQPPNLLLPSPEYGSLVSVTSDLKRPWHRLMLLGNLDGLFKTMDMCKAKPDIKTFTILLETLPHSDEMEEALIQMMKKKNVKIDIDFCNLLIKKRNSSVRFSSGLSVLNLIREEKLKPNIVTYGVLAMGCNDLQSTKQLVSDIADSGFRINNEILTVFLRRAKVSLNIDVVLFTIRTLTSENIVPDNKFYKNLIYFRDAVIQNLELKENNKRYVTGLDSDGFNKKFSKFLNMLDDIKSSVKDPSSVHPWDQFKEKSTSG